MDTTAPLLPLPTTASSPVPGRAVRGRGGEASYDRLAPSQRRAMVGAIAALHVAAGWSLLQVREVREAVADVAPLFVSIVAPERPKVEPVPPPPPPAPQRRIEPAPRVIAAAPSPAPAPFVVAAPPPEAAEPTPVVAAPAPAVAAAPPPPAPAPAPAPRVIPASAVQYLEPPAPEYPRLSKRLGEVGRVVIRVFIDEAGTSRDPQINRSSGFARLDDAALAAVQKARFKPYTENGQAVSGWTFVPIDFELEK